MCNTRIDELAYIIVANPWFDRVMIVVILTNCVFLALYDPTKESDAQEGYIKIGDMVFSGIFIVEILVKWLALGIPAYFKDKWNWVDFIVVMESKVSLVLGAALVRTPLDISALRALRVLRPLRAIAYLTQVKLLFETVIGAFRVVSTLLLCITCVLLFFGNVGYTFWAGAFDRTCVDGASHVLDVGLVCGAGYACPEGFSCELRSSAVHEEGDPSSHFKLDHGVTGFYDIWHAILQAFRVVTLDGWQELMWNTQDARGQEAWVYYVLLVFVGSVICVSMFPAVVSTKLEAAIAREEGAVWQRRLDKEQGNAAGGESANKRRRASEFELLLHEYAKMEAEEVAVFKRSVTTRDGGAPEMPEENSALPPWTPFGQSIVADRLRKAVGDDRGLFSFLVYGVIILNALVLSLHRADASRQRGHVLSTLNYVFSVFFCLEVVLKLAVLGPVAYSRDGYNVFDFAVTCLGLVEMIVEDVESFTALRVMRVLRIARVARFRSFGRVSKSRLSASAQVDFARMVKILLSSLPWIFNIYAVLLLLMYTFAVLGMQFFGRAVLDVDSRGDNGIAFNYRSFGKAFVTLLDLLTGNLWSMVMSDTVGAMGSQTCIVFYVVWLVLSRWLVGALVIAVFLYRVGVDTEDYLKVAVRNSMRSVFALERAFVQCHKRHAFLTWRKRYEEAMGMRASTRGQLRLKEYIPPPPQPGIWRRMVESPCTLNVFEPQNPLRQLCVWLTEPPTASELMLVASTAEPTAEVRREFDVPGRRGWWERLLARHGLRRFARFMVELVVVVAVIVNLVDVSMDVERRAGRREPSGGDISGFLWEVLVVVVFLSEAFVLSVARGFAWLPEAYLRDPINAIDFSVTLLSVLCLAAFRGMVWKDSSAVSTIKALRALRVVRLLKLASRAPGLARVLSAIRCSGSALCVASMVALFFWVQWAIVGLQLWAGTFSYCSDDAEATARGEANFFVYRTKGNGIEDQQDCENAGYQWKTADYNFDTLLQAMCSVLVVFTFNGWHEIMFSAINARVSSSGLNAVAWHKAWASLYFLCLVFTSMVLNLLLVGVVFSMYSFLNLTDNRKRLASLKQAFWAMYETKLMHIQPDTRPGRPGEGHGIRALLFDLAMNRRLQLALAVIIVANGVARFLVGSAYAHYRDAPTIIHVQEAIFATIFVGEWVCRTVAFGGLKAVTSSPFQVADMLATVVLFLGLLDEVLFMCGASIASSTFWKLVEAISTVRLVRLGLTFPDIQEMILVIFRSLSIISPLLIVWILVMYLWAIFGVVFFGNETYLADVFGSGNSWEAVNRYHGFYSVLTGMQTMFGVSMSSSSVAWIDMMERYQELTSGGFGRLGVYAFFMSYAFLTRLILVNLFMMVLLFKYKAHSNKKIGVAMEQVNQLKRAWINQAFVYTKEYESIYAGQLVALLQGLPPPLGVGPHGSYYDCQMLAKKVLLTAGVEDVRRVPARFISDVLRLSENPEGSGQALGYTKLSFSQVLRAVHRIVLFGATLDDEREVAEERARARMNLNVLKLGIHRLLAPGMNKRRASSAPWPLESEAVAEASLVRTQLPMIFMARSTMALTAEFLRWRDHIDVRGYDRESNAEGRCLVEAASRELEISRALEQVTRRVFDLHAGDRKLYRQVVDVKQHVATLKELRRKVRSVRAEHMQTLWDGSSLRVTEMLQDQNAGVTSICGSMDGEWVFCVTDSGMLQVFKLVKPPRTKDTNGKTRQDAQGGHYVHTQTTEIKPKRKRSTARAVRGVCLACSPDGFMVVIGCEDSTLRSFAQDRKGHRLAVQAMRAEGAGSGRPTVAYRPGVIGKAHKAALKCLVWYESGIFYSGGADGTVCMWRAAAATRPVQSVDLCRTIFSVDAVKCLTIWKTAYSLDLLAACVELDDCQEIEPPAYLLAGDSSGRLWVLPIRTDSKFFGLDVWEPVWKHRVQGAGAITAIEVAWGRIYTAHGSSGVIKAWSPLWADENNEKLSDLVEVGHYPMHSGEVTSIKYSKGLMFSASRDLSMVIWYPPHGVQESEATSLDDRNGLDGNYSPGGCKQAVPGQEAETSARRGDAQGNTGPRGGVREGIDRDQRRPSNDPGVVIHVEVVVGLVVTPRGIISADASGLVLMRMPERLTETYRIRALPGEADIFDCRASAVKVLKSRGSIRRPPPGALVTVDGAEATAGAALGLQGCSKGREQGRRRRPSALLSQASLDHIRSIRLLVRAKAKRRLREAIPLHREQAVDCNMLGVLTTRLHQVSTSNKPSSMIPRLEAQLAFFGEGTGDPFQRFKKFRRQTIFNTIHCSSATSASQLPERGGETQVAADASKLVEMIDMDKKPAFLDRVDLDQLADHPEVFLAELMMDFFPSKDLAPPGHRPDPTAQDRLPGAADNVARPMPGGRAGGGTHMFGLDVLLGLARGTYYAERARNAADMIGSRAAAMTAPSMPNLARLRSNMRRTLWGAVEAVSGRRNGDDGVRDDDDDRDGREYTDGNHPPDDEAPSNVQNPAQTDAQTMWDAMLARGAGPPSRKAPSKRGGWGRGIVRQVVPPGARSRKPGSTKGMAWGEETAVKKTRAETLEEGPREQSAPGGGMKRQTRRRIKHHVSFPSDIEAVKHDEDDAVGEDLSAAELRWRGNITVYIPRTPEPGAWAASVTFNPRESIAWVLGEALRMYAREHDPIPHCSGLARKPRLTSRSRRWWLRSSGFAWVQTAALPETASVGSVLRPGEELVVLVEGFQPSMAFGRSPSVCFASPSPSPLPQIEEGSTTGTPEEN